MIRCPPKWGNSTLRIGQLVCTIPPWSREGGGMGTVWLVRIHCPSDMTYEVAFPAGWVGDETAALNDGRRLAPLPERVVNSGGVASGTVERELRVARAIINALPRNPGGGRPPSTLLKTEIASLRRFGRFGQKVYFRVKSVSARCSTPTRKSPRLPQAAAAAPAEPIRNDVEGSAAGRGVGFHPYFSLTLRVPAWHARPGKEVRACHAFASNLTSQPLTP